MCACSRAQGCQLRVVRSTRQLQRSQQRKGSAPIRKENMSRIAAPELTARPLLMSSDSSASAPPWRLASPYTRDAAMWSCRTVSRNLP